MATNEPIICYAPAMHGNLRGRIRSGRLIIDEPVDLPEGTELDLVAIAPEDLSAEDRTRLDAAINRGVEDLAAGRVHASNDVLRTLRALVLP